jgi:multiple sugar transport system permease protein
MIVLPEVDTEATPPAPAAAPERSRGRGQGRLAALYLAPGMLGFLLFIIIPLVASLAISFYKWPLFGEPEFVGFDNYASLFSSDPVFWTVLGNTLVFAVCYTVLNLGISLGLATWLHHIGKWGPFFRVLFFIPVVTPMTANALIWRLMLSDNGVVNSGLAGIGSSGTVLAQ